MLHIILFSLIYTIYSETINRDVASSATISCTDFPCEINCNVASSCAYAIINCPPSTAGTGDCTINLNAVSAGQGSKIYATNVANSFTLVVGGLTVKNAAGVPIRLGPRGSNTRCVHL
eukprot:358863_1